VQEVLDLYQGATAEFVTDLDNGLPVIQADPGRLRQVLHNLVKNALEALEGTSRPRIALCTDCAAGPQCTFVEMRVQDNGPGFPEDILGHVFEPYVSTKPKGSGLGLAIVKKIVEDQGGVLWAENLTGGGARVVIRFAVKSLDREQERRGESEEEIR
jgi:nitrogen fixation/metabolism regulation signal transduction histidine kinase